MSHCGPPTAYFSGLMILLRICTPLLPTLASLTWNDISKSLYFLVLHRNVLYLRPSFGDLPTMAPSLTDQNWSIRPSNPDRSLPLKNVPASPAWAFASPKTALTARHARMRFMRVSSDVAV